MFEMGTWKQERCANYVAQFQLKVRMNGTGIPLKGRGILQNF